VRRTVVPVFVAAVFVSVGLGPAHADPESDGDGASELEVLADVGAAEGRCWAMSDSLTRLLDAAHEDADFDELRVLEAEEIAVIAEEFLAEGDVEVAASLFEEAIAILEPTAAVPGQAVGR
jgi:hypothetical protein